eukprot:Amastigsp_a510256_65.p1 type:complete len:144 gc:universal Amastigsp_a510256_65:362-793(+)
MACLLWTPRTRLQLSRIPVETVDCKLGNRARLSSRSRVYACGCAGGCADGKQSTHQELLMVFGCVASRRSSIHPKNSLKILVTSFLATRLDSSISRRPGDATFAFTQSPSIRSLWFAMSLEDSKTPCTLAIEDPTIAQGRRCG